MNFQNEGNQKISQLAAKLKVLKEEKGVSLEEIAGVLGINRSTVKRWLDGSTATIKKKYIENLERFFDVAPGYLFDSEEEYINLSYDYYRYDEIGYRSYARYLGKISAGLPKLMEDEVEYGTPKPKKRAKEEELFWLQIKGDSMNKIYRNGNYVLVRKQSYAQYGDCVAARINENEATVKYFKQEGNIVYLMPHSTDPSFKVQVYDLKKDSIEIMGVVLEGRIEGERLYF